MENKDRKKQSKQEKGFFARLIASLDRRLEEKSKSTGCCDRSKGKGLCC